MRAIETARLLAESVVFHRGFKRKDIQPIDGSFLAGTMIDDLATQEGALMEKLFALYACGVHEYQPQVFDPRQVLKMIRYNDPYQPGRIVRMANGGKEGVFCCVSPKDKEVLLRRLCEAIENRDPSPAPSLELLDTRERLVSAGVERYIVDEISDRALIIYFIANQTHFILKLIHPFWERNGRTSEEFMHLICATHSVDRRAFWTNAGERLNPVTIARMEIIDTASLSLLEEIAQQMGMEQGQKYSTVDNIYQAWFERKNEGRKFKMLQCLRKATPLKYMQSQAVFPFNGELMEEYFEALKKIVESMIDEIADKKVSRLLGNKVTQSLVANQLTHGVVASAG